MRGGGGGAREGGPQGVGDSWHERDRERRRDGRQERDNVMSVFEMIRIFMTSIYLRLHKAYFCIKYIKCGYSRKESPTLLIEASCAN